jgi:hypothetical protein
MSCTKLLHYAPYGEDLIEYALSHLIGTGVLCFRANIKFFLQILRVGSTLWNEIRSLVSDIKHADRQKNREAGRQRDRLGL